MNHINDKISSEYCYGCTACFNICPNNSIKMVSNENGFLHPLVDIDNCLNCGQCVKVCPLTSKVTNSKPESAYVYKHSQESVLSSSTSGGAFTAITDFLLNNNYIIWGALYDENFVVKHSMAENAEERNKFRGSKYVQSDLTDVFKKIKIQLKNNQNVCFSGTPCQVAGLKNYLLASGTKTNNLLLIDLICHGVPSPGVFADFIKFIEKYFNRKLETFNFRSKNIGWKNYPASAKFKDGLIENNTNAISIIRKMYFSKMTMRQSCYHCEFSSTSRVGDITISDAWGVETFLPEFDFSYGASLVLVNNEKAKNLFDSIDEFKSAIDVSDKDYENYQQNLRAPTPMQDGSQKFWENYRESGMRFAAKAFGDIDLDKEKKE